ncbi:acyl carrier protein [Streptomyces sp. SID10853]|uniref:phosphopantetheine-binding protein n=1 Tax=Streptomyces sp. SID10853 TaxID=2706028 RepID=UPI0013C06291|nr:acyl carrier protein [Streptomyces sp. SID10853]
MTSPERIETPDTSGAPERTGAQVRGIIAAALGPSAPPDIGLDDELHALGIDSLTILEIVVRVEQECGIKIGDSEIFEAPLKRVGDLVKLVTAHVENS